MKKKTTKISPVREVRINCSYAPEVLCPEEALPREYYELSTPDSAELFVTNDGKRCKPTFVMSWSRIEENKMDAVCEGRWGCRFGEVRSLWYDRLRSGSRMDRWHLIKLDIV